MENLKNESTNYEKTQKKSQEKIEELEKDIKANEWVDNKLGTVR